MYKEVFKLTQGAYNSEFEPLKDLNNKQYEELLEEFELDIDKFYSVKGRLFPVCYKNGPIVIGIYIMNKEYFINFRVKEIINQQEIRFNELLSSGNYKSLFTFIDKPYRLEWYYKLYNKIPDEDKYDIFIDIYTGSEYGFNNYNIDFIKDVIRYKRTNNENYNMLEDVITIYRGEGSKSTPYNKAYSWTTNIEIARFFAKRFDNNGNIYKAQVNKEDIIDYLCNRNEEEIIVYPHNVYNVELLEVPLQF